MKSRDISNVPEHHSRWGMGCVECQATAQNVQQKDESVVSILVWWGVGDLHAGRNCIPPYFMLQLLSAAYRCGLGMTMCSHASRYRRTNNGILLRNEM